MRLVVLVLAVFLSGCVNSKKKDDSGPIFIDGVKSTVQPPKPTTVVGDDEDVSGSGVMSDGSGSGSGTDEPPTTIDVNPTTIDVSVISPSRRVSTRTQIRTQETTTIGNEVPNVTTTKKPKDKTKPTTEISNNAGGADTYGGGPGGGNTKEGDDSDPKALKREYQVLTTEVVAAIVVGAVCAIILIVFLVYRLRKRDEGSYALTDGGYNDTYKLKGEGKEAFV